MNQENYSIILFDGVCNFCNYWVNFIIDRDINDRFKFASLQSEYGQELLREFNLPADNFDSFILISGDQIFQKSEAAFKISQNLVGWPRLIAIFSFLPRFITNFVYDLIAKNRYKFFGKRDSCRIPTQKEKSKFL